MKAYGRVRSMTAPNIVGGPLKSEAERIPCTECGAEMCVQKNRTRYRGTERCEACRAKRRREIQASKAEMAALAAKVDARRRRLPR